MTERSFALATFYLRVGASTKERSALRQDFVRGLKDYYEQLYGYDRYGAETIFQLPERMGIPYVFGFGLRRLLHDRRLSDSVKVAAAEVALEMMAYRDEQGSPHALFGALDFLARHDALPLGDLRYALICSAGDPVPFRGLDKTEIIRFVETLVGTGAMPVEERLFWTHTLIARHGDAPGAADLVTLILAEERFERSLRIELARAWVHARQPRLAIQPWKEEAGGRETAIAAHLPFWVAHAPSWPSNTMVRLGLLWLARLGEDPVALAEAHLGTRTGFAEQLQLAVADILHEHHASILPDRLRELVDQGAHAASIPIRRKFYRLGAVLYGPEYLQHATEDSAGSLRQWAVRELDKAR